MSYQKRIVARLRELSDVPRRMTALNERVGDLATAMWEAARAERPPFVSVLVECEVLVEPVVRTHHYEMGPSVSHYTPPPEPRAVPSSMGKAHVLSERHHTFQFSVQRPLRSVRLLVIADMSRVRVEGFYIGTDLVTASLDGDTPCAYFAGVVQPGLLIRVIVERRDP